MSAHPSGRRSAGRPARGAWVLVAAATAAACGGAAPAPPPAPTPEPVPETGLSRTPLHGSLPPVPRRDSYGRSVTLVYPPRGATVATDSTFVFGSTSLLDAALTINGTPVPVEANGAFLAYLEVPPDGWYRVEARAGGDPSPVTLEWPINGAEATAPPARTDAPDAAVASVREIRPDGYTLAFRDEPVTFHARAPAGARLALLLPDGRRVPMFEASRPQGSAGFGESAARNRVTAYEATVELAVSHTSTVGEDERGGPGYPIVVAPPPYVLGADAGARGSDVASGQAFLEAVVDGDTTFHVLPTLGVLEPGYAYDAEIRTARADSTAIGRATLPPGTPYHWFLPNGTRVRVTGIREGQARIRLTRDLSIWVAAEDLAAVEQSVGMRRSRGTPGEPSPAVVALPDPPRGSARGDAYSVRVTPDRGWLEVRVALSERLPFRVDPREGGLDITVYGARTRTNWAYQGPDDPYLRRAWWEQADDERYVVHVETAGSPWGWDARWAGPGTLVVRVRRPPALDPADPLRGVYVGVDAGHGDETGAIGPTELREGDANRAIAKRVIALLRERGARVLEIRPGADDIPLGDRPLMAADSGVDVLLSVHNNAFPDGVDPFENAGTSVLYNTWQSLPLARALERELVDELGLRDLGAAWGDLALARPTWMPSALTETMFLMIPVQEASLRNPAVQERIAAAHVRGLEAFLRERSTH